MQNYDGISAPVACPAVTRASRTTICLILTSALVLLSTLTRVHGETVDDDALASEYKEICIDYIEEAKAAIESGGKTSLYEKVLAQYVDHPAGPYLFCKYNIPENPSDFGQVTEFIHPKLEGEEREGDDYEALTGQAAELFKEQRQIIARLAYENRQTSDLFEYTVNINQTQSLNSSWFSFQSPGSGRQYIAFSDEYDEPDGKVDVFYCACPYTKVPHEPRDNTNAIAAQAAAASSSVPIGNWFLNLLSLMAVTIIAHVVF
jgi:uncharacterized membrane protein